MKLLFMLALFIPFSTLAQRFEISEQAGYSTISGFTVLGDDFARSYGFTNQVSVGYRCLKHFSVSAFYQFNNWDNHNNAYGISPDFVTKHFYAGLDLQMATFSPIALPQVIFNTSWGCGLHIGSKQKIWKRLSATEQAGYDIDNIRLTTKSGPYMAIDGSSEAETLHIWYLRAGLSYRI